MITAQRLASAAAIAFLSCSLAASASSRVRGSGNMRSESRRVAEFDEVQVGAGIHATITEGSRFVEVKADDNVLSRVTTEVKDGVLEVGLERGLSFWSDVAIEVSIRTPQLKGAHASGGAEIHVASARPSASLRLTASGGGVVAMESVQTKALEVGASGGGRVLATGFEVDSLRAEGSGGGTIKLSGRAAEAVLEMSGGATVKARGLTVGKLHVEGSGGGTATLKTAQAVRGSLSGGSTLHVGGNPQSRVRTSGGGEVVYEDDKD